MQGINKFCVEINEDFYKSYSFKSLKLHLPHRGGSLGDLKPKHGKVTATVDDKIKVGYTVFFIHFGLYEIDHRSGKSYVLIDKESLLGYSEDFPDTHDVKAIKAAEVHSYSFIPATKVDNPVIEDLRSRGIIPPNNMQRHIEHIFRIQRDEEILDLKKDDIVWVYTNSDYPIDYLEDLVFIEPRWITFNATQQKTLNGYTLIRVEQQQKEEKIILDRKIISARGIGEVLEKGEKYKSIEIGSKVRFHMSPNQKCPLFTDVFQVPYGNIIGKYAK